MIFLIIILAAVLRFMFLGSIPTGFNDDEAAFGYNAYSILKQGYDEWGRTLPFPTFESFGDWKLVFYLYLTVISQFIFGVSEFATRFPSALFGVFTTIATYFLAKELFDKKVGLIAALFVAISPWQIVASRNAFESDLLSFFITVGVYFFILSIKTASFKSESKRILSEDQNPTAFRPGDSIKSKVNIKYFFLSSIFFTLCFYIYRSSWFFVPLFVASQLYLFREHFHKSKKVVLINFALVLILLIPLIPVVLTFRGQSRFVQESFITGVQSVGITNEVNERRGNCTKNLSSQLCTVIYNKYQLFLSSYTSNYIKNLSYETFFEKSSPTGFQSFMKRSAFYLFELPLIVAGLIFMFKTKSTAAKVLIPWILLAPVGAAITGIGNYGRINLIMPAPQILGAIGLVLILKVAAKYKLHTPAVIAAVVIIVFSTVKMAIDILYVEPVQTSTYQRYGYKELFSYLSGQKQYDHFIISRKIDNSHQYIQYLYFQKVDPKFLQENAIRTHDEGGWVITKSIGKFIFVQSIPGIETIPPKTLLVVGPKEVPFPTDPIRSINYLNGVPGFLVYDIDQVKAKIEADKQLSK